MTTRVYVAGPNGFTEAGLAWHKSVVLPALVSARFEPLDPWLDAIGAWFDEAFAIDDYELRKAALVGVNHRVGQRNLELIDACGAVLANLEGADVDSGTAAEIGYACAKGKPVFAFRPDLRITGDNIATEVNLQVERFIRASGGEIYPTLGEAIAAINVV